MRPHLLTAMILVLLGSTAGVAPAQIITVTSGTDVIDIDTETATVADLPGPDGKVYLFALRPHFPDEEY